MSSPSQLAADTWNRRLSYFRFHFAHGGHANDMDQLSASIRFRPGEDGLLDAFSRLAVELRRIPPDQPRREPGRTYNSADWDRYADPISAYPAFHQPGFCRIADRPCHLSVAADRISLLISGASGNAWVVDEADFQNAATLESLLPMRGLRFVRIASRATIERLFLALHARGLPDLKTRQQRQPAGSARNARHDDYAAVRATDSELADDDVWNDAHSEIHALLAAARAARGRPSLVAYRCPGFSTAIVERACGSFA